MSYEVTPLRLDEHRGALARLWAENMSDSRIASVIPDRMRWLYEEAPDGPATTVLALHAESGEVVGCGSFLGRPTWIDGRRVRAAVLCDFAVTRAHRVAGAALAIQRALVDAARAAGLELVYGYPNAKSVAVFKRIGYRVVGETTAWVKPLRSGYKLREVLRPRWAAAAAALAVDAGLLALDVARGVRTPRADALPLPPGDPRTDARGDQRRADGGVVGERTARYLAWRYGRFTTAEHRVLAISPRGEKRLSACAVYSLERGKAVLRDLLADPAEGAAEALLLALARRLRRDGTEALLLTYLGGPAFPARLRRLGFMLRPTRRPLVVHPDLLDGALRDRVLDPASWFMLDGELDI